MVGHPAFGSALVDPLRPWLGDALSAVDGHHERFDGTGYPYRRPSGSLPVAARVAAVADAFETMTAARSYKDPVPLAAARAEVAACAGGHFDPAVCRAFLALSLPRLWRVAGPLSWLAQIPLIGVVVRGEIIPVAVSSAAQGAALATGQAVTAAAVVGGALLVGGAADHGLAPDAGRTTPAEIAASPTGTDPARGSTDPGDSGNDDGSNGGGGSGTDRPGTDPDRPGNDDPTVPDPTVPGGEDPGGPGSSTDPLPPSGGGGGRVVGGVVDPVVDAVDDVVGRGGGGGVVGGVVDPVVDAVDDVVGGLLGSGSGNSGSGRGHSGSGGGGSGNSGSGGGLLGGLLGGGHRGQD